MESFEREIKKYAIVIKINLLRATLNEASEFKDYLNEAILGSDVDIVVNLSDCQHLDSTFLGVLVSGYKRMKKKNRTMVIIEPTDQSSVFLTLNSIGKIFPLYESVQSALEDIENKKMLDGIVENLDDRIQSKEKDLQVEEAPTKLSEVKVSESGLVTLEEVFPETINQNNLNSVEEVHKEEIVKGPEPKPLYSDVNFRKGSVEWAFGFN
jgi:anti-anti-sigma factor